MRRPLYLTDRAMNLNLYTGSRHSVESGLFLGRSSPGRSSVAPVPRLHYTHTELDVTNVRWDRVHLVISSILSQDNEDSVSPAGKIFVP